MNLNSPVEQNVAHWLLLTAFCLSLAFSFYAFFKITNLETISVSAQSGISIDSI